MPADNARLLAEGIPGAKLRLWGRAGHLYVTDEPRADREVARFLWRHTDERAARAVSPPARSPAPGAASRAADARPVAEPRPRAPAHAPGSRSRDATGAAGRARLASCAR